MRGLETCDRSGDESVFLVVMGTMVLFLQAGFAMLEAGSVSHHNVTSVLTKQVWDVILGALSYYLFGYAFSLGTVHHDSVLGGTGFALEGVATCNYSVYFYQYSFAATATTILSGAIAERATIMAYMTYAILITGFIYPCVVYWTWSQDAWLSKHTLDGHHTGYTDFAGSGIVHMTGGCAALVGTWLIGPRMRRLGPDGQLLDLKPHSTPLIALGTFILLFGFFAFNALSEEDTIDNGEIVAITAVNTILAGAAGGFVAGVLYMIQTDHLHLSVTCNGLLAGIVAVCAGVNSYRPWAAIAVGGISGGLYYLSSRTMPRLKIDDAVDAISVHLVAGVVGVLLQPIFTSEDGLVFNPSAKHAWLHLGWNTLGAVVILSWTAATCGIMFWVLKVMGRLRVSEEVERQGLDVVEYGEAAYFMPSSVNHEFSEATRRFSSVPVNGDPNAGDDAPLLRRTRLSGVY